jgi:hypothetical protein
LIDPHPLVPTLFHAFSLSHTPQPFACGISIGQSYRLNSGNAFLTTGVVTLDINLVGLLAKSKILAEHAHRPIVRVLLKVNPTGYTVISLVFSIGTPLVHSMINDTWPYRQPTSCSTAQHPSTVTTNLHNLAHHPLDPRRIR